MTDALTPKTLASHVRHCPAAPGVYRLYLGQCLLHVGMAAGAATLRSEIRAHVRGDYGARTQAADRVEWEVAPDSVRAYQRFLTLNTAARVAAMAPDEASPSRSARYSTGHSLRKREPAADLQRSDLAEQVRRDDQHGTHEREQADLRQAMRRQEQ